MFYLHLCNKTPHAVYIFWSYVLFKNICKHVATTEACDMSLISWHTLQGTNQFGEGAGLQSLEVATSQWDKEECLRFLP